MDGMVGGVAVHVAVLLPDADTADLSFLSCNSKYTQLMRYLWASFYVLHTVYVTHRAITHPGYQIAIFNW